MDEDEQARLLDLLDRPVFILESSGIIRKANRAWRNLLGYDPTARRLEEVAADPPARVHSYLARCAASGQAVMGSLTIRTHADEILKVQSAGSRLSARGQAPPLIGLYCSAERTREFSILARHVDGLNLEIRKRRKAQEELERALSLKEILLHELHHRMKNQMQMLLAMFSIAGRRTDYLSVSAFVESMTARLRAMTAAHDLMYDAERLATVPAREFLKRLVETISESWPPDASIALHSTDVELRNDVAVPLALIAQELLANALKHGLKFGGGRVTIELSSDGTALLLAVRDDGPGFAEPPASRQSSGLTLVRGLCQQIGGSLEISRGGETCFIVRFPRS